MGPIIKAFLMFSCLFLFINFIKNLTAKLGDNLGYSVTFEISERFIGYLATSNNLEIQNHLSIC